jgi:hypothetical protein
MSTRILLIVAIRLMGLAYVFTAINGLLGTMVFLSALCGSPGLPSLGFRAQSVTAIGAAVIRGLLGGLLVWITPRIATRFCAAGCENVPLQLNVGPGDVYRLACFVLGVYLLLNSAKLLGRLMATGMQGAQSTASRGQLIASAIAVGFALSCHSQDISAISGGNLSQKLPWETVYQADGPLVFPVGSDPVQRTVSLPSVPAQEAKTLCIRFRALYPVQEFAVKLADYYVKIEINGKVVGGYTTDGSERLLNRRGKFHIDSGQYPWWNGDKLAIMFGLDNGGLDPRVIEPRHEEYWYVLDVSDLAEYLKRGADNHLEGGLPNSIAFTSGCTKANTRAPLPAEMRVENLSLGYLRKDVVERIRAVKLVGVPKIEGQRLAGEGCQLTLAPAGAMVFECGQDRYAIRSGFSYASDTISYHQFTWDDAANLDWHTTLLPVHERGALSLKGESARYGVTRRITSKDGKFSVADSIENKTDAPLGMSIRYEVVVPGQIGGEQAYLAGAPNIIDNTECSNNPTVLLKQAHSSLGIAVEDTVFAYQLSMCRRPNSVQFGTEHFGLEPHKSYTLQWTLYPSREPDYWGFINRLRKDWNVNFTIPGMVVWSPRVPPGLKASMYCVPPWLEFYEAGKCYSNEEWLMQVKRTTAKLLAAQPDAIPLAEIETPSVGILRSSISDGNLIPKTPKKMGLELTAAQCKVLETLPYWNSMLKSSSGRALIDTWYAGAGGVDDFNLMLYPAIGNHQYQHILWQTDYAMANAGFKGIYFDSFEFNPDLHFGYRTNYGQWDGHTVDLNHRGEIASKFTDAALVSVPARVAILRHVIEKGGAVVANGHPGARELRSLPYITTAETMWEMVPDFDAVKKLLAPGKPAASRAAATGHLASPIGQGIGLWRSDLFGPSRNREFATNHAAEIIQKYVILLLRNGSLFVPYAAIPSAGPGKGEYGILNHMYPFTPVELHEGYLVGKERILTAVSGTFEWDHSAKPMCLTFDCKGYRTTPDATMVKKARSWDVTVRLQDWNATAVIMTGSE